MTSKTLASLALAAGTVLLASSASYAQLAHRYSFNTDGAAEDSVGGADGTLLATGTTVAGGVLTTDGSNGQTAGVSLTAAAVAGINGSFTVTNYFNATQPQGDFHTGYSFSDGTDQNFLVYTPVRNADAGFASSAAFATAGTQTIVTGPIGDQNNPHIATTVYDASTGTASYYLDGNLANTGSAAGFDLSTKSSKIGINGNSPFGGDASLTGSTDEFRIYNVALTASQVSVINALGADAPSAAINAVVPEPTSLGLLGLGGLGLLARRRRTA